MQRGGAKINVGLHLVGKRPDGYHLLETLFYPVDHLFDLMLVERDEGEGCVINMEGIDEEIPLEGNLIYKAWKLMAEQLEKKHAGVTIRVKKEFPLELDLAAGHPMPRRP